VQQVHEWRSQANLSFHIAVDGGVDLQTVTDCARAGADTFISGTALFRQRNMGAAVRKMRKLAEAAGSSVRRLSPAAAPVVA
jgi:ribulose-phosphate 3-epimerase